MARMTRYSCVCARRLLWLGSSHKGQTLSATKKIAHHIFDHERTYMMCMLDRICKYRCWLLDEHTWMKRLFAHLLFLSFKSANLQSNVHHLIHQFCKFSNPCNWMPLLHMFKALGAQELLSNPCPKLAMPLFNQHDISWRK